MSIRTKVVSGGYTRLLRPILFRSFHGDPEMIHEQMIRVLAAPAFSAVARTALKFLISPQGRPTTVAGIDFPNRVGLAAGMDKDGHAVKAWAPLGFGFAEVGTVTGQAQKGNDRPRVFRLPSSKALINRMGFNNDGAAALAKTLAAAGVYRGNNAAGIPIGISIGKTKKVPLEAAIEDYLSALTAVVPHADYVAINVSSPNTPNLRKLQSESALAELATELTTLAANLGVRHRVNPVPLFVKIAPDLNWPAIDAILTTCETTGISGVIATNTTLSRDGIKRFERPVAAQTGGLSGRPLARRAREVVGYVTAHTSLPVIGCGGVMTPNDALALFDVGASLVQLYTGFIYSGPALAVKINAFDLHRTGLSKQSKVI
ncbi:MAG: quinone-dependent dihydroorotate dehydrogenase [Propionibacteriaceae bacterium]|jgi:dihydroorotate dehydrogenase|nr:quinone-dependent dihydroorotate dehydrogenase [Propionibacteriaceae bacterium]